MRIKTAFTSILGIFVRSLINFCGFYGKTHKIKICIIILVDRGRRVRSVKINNRFEIETSADEKLLLFRFCVFLFVL